MRFRALIAGMRLQLEERRETEILVLVMGFECDERPSARTDANRASEEQSLEEEKAIHISVKNQFVWLFLCEFNSLLVIHMSGLRGGQRTGRPPRERRASNRLPIRVSH